MQSQKNSVILQQAQPELHEPSNVLLMYLFFWSTIYYTVLVRSPSFWCTLQIDSLF